jgi:hypothetical protein
VIETLTTVLTYAALAAAAWAAVLVVAGKPVELRKWHGLGLYGLALLLEVALLVLVVAGIVRLATTDRELETATYVGYLVAPVLLLPLAAFWALTERTRWGPSVMIIGCLAVPVLLLRLEQVWNAYV